MDLYQASFDKKGKQIESHTDSLKENSTDANNAIVVYNAIPPIDIKNLNAFKFFFEDPNGEIGHLIHGGIIGPEDNN